MNNSKTEQMDKGSYAELTDRNKELVEAEVEVQSDEDQLEQEFLEQFDNE